MLIPTIVALAWIAPLQDVDNPEYKLWSSFKAGAYVKEKTVFDPNPSETEFIMTQTLLEVTPEKVVIELKPTLPSIPPVPPTPPTDKAPPTIPSPFTRTIFAKIKAPVEPSETKPEVKKEGDEEIEVAGKTLKCHWVETVLDAPTGGKSTMRIWYCTAIPGGVARREMKTEAAVTSTTKTWVTEFKVD